MRFSENYIPRYSVDTDVILARSQAAYIDEYKVVVFGDGVSTIPELVKGPPAVNVTSDYDVQFTDDCLFVDCTSGNIIVNLLSSPVAPNRTLWIKKIDSSANKVIITAFADRTELIDGDPTHELQLQYEQVGLRPDGGYNFYILSYH